MAVDVKTASLEELRDLVGQLLEERAAQAVAPLGVDSYSHLPVHLDKPECPLCRRFEPRRDPETGNTYRVCHDCNGLIEHSIEFQNRGIESVTVDHLHLHEVTGARGQQIRVIARRELCIPCFRIDWAKQHPEKPCDL